MGFRASFCKKSIVKEGPFIDGMEKVELLSRRIGPNGTVQTYYIIEIQVCMDPARFLKVWLSLGLQAGVTLIICCGLDAAIGGILLTKEL